MRALIVEDEFMLAAALVRGLRNHGISSDVAGSGELALEKIGADSYDVVILDRRLPGIDGDEVCRRLRSEGSEIRILMLTALNEIEDRVAGLEVGADDYVGKPVSLDELVARLHALSRREGRLAVRVVTHRGITLIPERGLTQRDGRDIALTATELALLAELVDAAGGVVTLERLRISVWGSRYTPPNTVRAAVMRLRRKLGEPLAVETVTGLGYRLR